MSEAPAAQLQPAADAAPAVDARRTPLAFVIDGESSNRHFVSLVLHGNGIDTLEFADSAELRAARIARPPDLVLLDVSVDMQDALGSMDALGNLGNCGAVQLMSGRGAAVLETFRQAGEKYGLPMLPVLKKPLEAQALQGILRKLKLGNSAPARVRVELSEALRKNWIEFWYQPKIDLRKKQLAGADAVAHVRHPRHGMLSPLSFVPGADEPSLQALAERALADALEFGRNLSLLGVNLRIAVDMPVGALTKLPIADMARAHRAQAADWAGLVLDLAEQQIVGEMTLARELATTLAPHNVKLAIDHFGRALPTLMRRKDLPFAELKLDRSFVAGCGTDKVNAPICKAMIDLAHSFGSLAVGTGMDTGADVRAMTGMGCDLGQGALLGRPMPEERFVSLLKQRAPLRPVEQPPDH